MAGNSVYEQTKHKQWRGGFQRSPRASLCFNCKSVAPYETLYKGWCQACIAAWKQTADVAVVSAAADDYAASRKLSVGALAQLERLKERILSPKADEDFLPLTRFMGSRGVGHQQTWWNILLMMHTLEVETTSQLAKIGKESHDTLHLCGRHSAVDRTSLSGFLSRINSVEDFKPWNTATPAFRDYVRGFVADNKMWVWSLRPLASGDAKQREIKRSCSEAAKDKRRRQRAYQKELASVPTRPCSAFWPFSPNDADEQSALLLAIDAAVPRYLPTSIREDVCQDLVVAVLIGDCTLENLHGSLPRYIRDVFRLHPTKYGAYSLDHPAPWMHGEDDRTLGEIIAAGEFGSRLWAGEDEAHESDGWHHGRNRAVGITTLGEQCRAKANGVAVPDLIVPEDESISADVLEVYVSDMRPAAYRGLRK